MVSYASGYDTLLRSSRKGNAYSLVRGILGFQRGGHHVFHGLVGLSDKV